MCMTAINLGPYAYIIGTLNQRVYHYAKKKGDVRFGMIEWYGCKKDEYESRRDSLNSVCLLKFIYIIA